MFDFKGVKSPERLNKDFVLNRISDAMIFGLYHGPFKVGDVYPSKFRKDRNPSCGFYISSSGKLIYNDISTREKLDAFAFVAKLYRLDFKTTVERIAKDFGLVGDTKSIQAIEAMESMRSFDRKHKKRTKINFTAGKWTSERLAFWKQYHVTKKDLEEEGVFPIKKLYINDQYIPNPDNNNRYALTLQHKGETLTKVYSPGTTDSLKWVSSIPLEIPFGMDKLNYKSDKCFTWKAVKDKMVMKRFFDANIAAQNESLSAMPLKVRDHLQFNFERNYCGWDNDETGLAAMEEMATVGFTSIIIPVEWNEKYGIKDWSDLAKIKGLHAVERLLKELKLI